MQRQSKLKSEPNVMKAADQTTARAATCLKVLSHPGPSKEQGPAEPPGTLLVDNMNPCGTHPGRGQPTCDSQLQSKSDSSKISHMHRKLAAFNRFGDSYQQDPTAVSLVQVSVPNPNAALQHITDSSCGFEAFSETAADVFVGACEAFTVEQPTGGDAAAALQAAAVAEAGASGIVRTGGAADWWGSEAMRMAGAVVACGGPVLAAAEMQRLQTGVEQLGEKLDSLAEVYHALPVLADTLFA